MVQGFGSRCGLIYILQGIIAAVESKLEVGKSGMNGVFGFWCGEGIRGCIQSVLKTEPLELPHYLNMIGERRIARFLPKQFVKC